MARFNRQRIVRPRPKYHWVRSTISSPQSLGVGLLSEDPILVRNDYRGNVGTSPSGVTAVRMVGSLRIGTTTPSAGAYFGHWGVAHVEEDEVPTAGASYDPSLNVQLTDERWLKTGVFMMRASGAALDYFQYSVELNFDIKQRVKLRDSGISIIIKSGAGVPGAIQYLYSCSVLIVGDTN